MSAARTMGPSGLALIKNAESCRLKAYQDSAGVWTIGWGHTSAAGAPAPHAGLQISQAEADTILSQDLVAFEGYVGRYVKVTLTQNQFDALVSLTYNIGPGNLAKSLLLRDVNAGDLAGAKAQFGRWTRAGGEVLPGLVTRRAREAELFGTPDSSDAAAPQPAPGDFLSGLYAMFDTAGAIIADVETIGAALRDVAPQLQTNGDNPLGAITTFSSLFTLVETFGPLVPEVVKEVPDIAAKAGKLAADVKKLDVTASIADLEALVAAAELPFHAITKTIQASHTMTAPAPAAA